MPQNYLFDTSILINHSRHKSSQSTEWVLRAAQNQIQGFISVVTWYEILQGAIDGLHTQQAKLILSPFKVISLTRDIAQIAADFYHNLPKGIVTEKFHLDIFIAATAEAQRLTILTTNSKHFKHIPTTVEIEYLQ